MVHNAFGNVAFDIIVNDSPSSEAEGSIWIGFQSNVGLLHYLGVFTQQVGILFVVPLIAFRALKMLNHAVHVSAIGDYATPVGDRPRQIYLDENQVLLLLFIECLKKGKLSMILIFVGILYPRGDGTVERLPIV